jgi:hypothetical protein
MTMRAALSTPVLRRAESDEIHPEAAELVRRAQRGGTPLDPKLRAQLEAVLGADLDSVRIHTGPEADAAARAVGARAFAIGQDVFFRAGAYAPGDRDGRRLIAAAAGFRVVRVGLALRALGRSMPELSMAQRGAVSRAIADDPALMSSFTNVAAGDTAVSARVAAAVQQAGGSRTALRAALQDIARIAAIPRRVPAGATCTSRCAGSPTAATSSGSRRALGCRAPRSRLPSAT